MEISNRAVKVIFLSLVNFISKRISKGGSERSSNSWDLILIFFSKLQVSEQNLSSTMVPLKALIKSVHLFIWYCVLGMTLPPQSWQRWGWGETHCSAADIDKIPTKVESWIWNTVSAAVTTIETATDRAVSSRYKEKRKKRQCYLWCEFTVSLCFQLWTVKTQEAVVATREGTGWLWGPEGGLLYFYCKSFVHPALPIYKRDSAYGSLLQITETEIIIHFFSFFRHNKNTSRPQSLAPLFWATSERSHI